MPGDVRGIARFLDEEARAPREEVRSEDVLDRVENRDGWRTRSASHVKSRCGLVADLAAEPAAVLGLDAPRAAGATPAPRPGTSREPENRNPSRRYCSTAAEAGVWSSGHGPRVDGTRRGARPHGVQRIPAPRRPVLVLHVGPTAGGVEIERARAPRAVRRWCRARRRQQPSWGSTGSRTIRRRGAPGRSTRRTSRSRRTGWITYWIETAHIPPSNSASSKGSRVSRFTSWTTWAVRCGLSGHLLGVQTQADDGPCAKARRQVAAPAAHQIEQAAARRKHLGIQAPERGDRAVVDVDDLARNDIEAIVRRLVVTREGDRRQQTVAGGRLRVHLCWLSGETVA